MPFPTGVHREAAGLPQNCILFDVSHISYVMPPDYVFDFARIRVWFRIESASGARLGPKQTIHPHARTSAAFPSQRESVLSRFAANWCQDGLDRYEGAGSRMSVKSLA